MNKFLKVDACMQILPAFNVYKNFFLGVFSNMCDCYKSHKTVMNCSS